ncbi:MAG: GDSL-type esterase/lipase family protein [Flavobacterium sp.]|nr:GDSL-type esterase/lipase family protein [Flavobacterium sp.]
MRIKLLAFLFFVGLCSFAQDSTEVFLDEVEIDTATVVISEESNFSNEIINSKSIHNFYQKLAQLEKTKNCKLRIVHIGDSHIQADLFTGKMRSLLQERFGNGGLGFSFPYNLAKTNGNYFIKYSTTTSFESYRNIYSDTTKLVGLSGIALETRAKDFAIELSVRDKSFSFNTIKVITPNNKKLFDLATASKEIKIESSVPKTIVHKIKKGEAISIIADKYNVSITALKKANGLKNNNIQAGKTLKIPTNEMQPQTISRKEFLPLELYQDKFSHNYYSNDLLEKIYLIPSENKENYALNGVVLENNNSGIVYNAIGVNGAKATDYNKFPMFFNQLKSLEADLVVISLGTNESFDKQDATTYFTNLNEMILAIKSKNPAAEILVTTPPPSLFKRKYPNTIVADYSRILLEKAEENNFAVWNMFEALGGLYSVNKNYSKGFMSKDKVHYSKAGYEWQATLFYDALFNSYEDLKHE